MGDRCFAKVLVKPCYAQWFIDNNFTHMTEDPELQSGEAVYVDEEVNYAGLDWFPTDIIYRGTCGPGDNYPATIFVCLGDGTVRYIDLDFHGNMYISVDDNGHIDPESVKDLNDFLEYIKQYEQLIKAKPIPKVLPTEDIAAMLGDDDENTGDNREGT